MFFFFFFSFCYGFFFLSVSCSFPYFTFYFRPASVLAQRFGITEQTVYKWKKRDVFADRSHTAHHLQTVLTPAQEAVVVHLRRTLLLPLDDLLAVTREFICPHVSRSGLDRCLRRHGAGNLNALKPQAPAVAHKAFKSYEPGYVHMDVKYLPQMQDESSRRYLFVAIDRATRWVFVQLKSNKSAASPDGHPNSPMYGHLKLPHLN